MKRLFDLAFALVVLTVASPIILTALFAVWAYDRKSPIYRAPRVGRDGREFMMMKIRSMHVGADRSGVNSTAADDRRITPIGALIRRAKLDEVSQFWNVLKGEMSVVGPRPNTRADVAAYTTEERGLLTVPPGITDLSSIVFSDEGAILAGAADADGEYNRVIRPWKSRLGLLYVRNASLPLDIQIIFLTALALVSKPRALRAVERIVARLGADETLRATVRRDAPLAAGLPPGA